VPALLPCGGFASGDAAGHGVDRGPADHGFGGGGVAFVVAGEAAVSGEPGQGAFDAPAARNDGEAVLAFGFAHDAHHGGEDGAAPVDELAGEAAVGEDEPVRADQVRREQGGLGTVTVLHARGEHDDHDERAQGVGDDERFLPLIFLPLSRYRDNGQLSGVFGYAGSSVATLVNGGGADVEPP
jgi:hypothetical protein